MDNQSLQNEQGVTDPGQMALQPAEPENGKKPAKKKTGFWKGLFIGILITLVVLFLAVGGVLAYINHQISRTIADAEAQTGVVRRGLDYQTINDKLTILKRVVDRYFLFDSDVDDMETGIYRGMISALDDPYTVYYTPEEYTELTEETEGSYCGIGALVSQNLDTGIVTIIRVFANSPAEQAGIMRGDILYKVNGIEAATQDLDLLVSQEIRGEEGTTADIVVLRDDEELEFEVIRGPVEVETVDYRLLDDGRTGYILVSEFDQVTAAQFEEAVDDLESQGMTQLVIDLRDNPGGVLDTAVSMAAYILPDDLYDGTIISTADRNGRGVRYYSSEGEICYEANDGSRNDYSYPKDDNHELNIPIAILVNGNSASAAELFSGALRDYGKASLVGTTTFGKGIVQSLIPLDDGSAVKITTSHYYTPSGYDLHEVGLEPDLEIEYEIPEDMEAAIEDPYSHDNQLTAAIELLDEQSKADD